MDSDPEKAVDDVHEKQTNSVAVSATFKQSLKEVSRRRQAAGVPTRELGLLFQDLHVLGLGATASHQDTVGSLINPANILSSIQSSRHPPIRDILNGFEGVVKPGEMLLVLGRPDSGCSTFLKALGNRRDEYYSVQGEVSYDGLLPAMIEKHYRGDVLYSPEDDVHFPTLTVAQTIRFAARLRAPREHLGASRAAYAEELTDLLMKTFGLEHAKNTPIGDAMIHGISGGEKKRVSLCEALATRACITAWDNSTRGLDSSTALEFIQNMRAATDICRLTTIMSLYQASESIFELFDKVCLIYEGRMAYYGPASQARQYFINLGYEPANRQTTPDFLVSVTDPNARIPRQVMHAPPRSAVEFADYFRASNFGQRNKEEITSMRDDLRDRKEGVEAYQSSAEAEHTKMARAQSPYIQSILVQSQEVVIRQVQIFRGSLFVTITNLFAFAFQGVIIGTVYLKSPDTTAAFFSRSGVIFFALLFAALMAMSEIPALFSQRPIILRHRNWALYHPFIQAVALTLVDLPVSFGTSLVFGGLIYGLVGLQKSAGQFFIFFLFVFSLAVVMRAYFRALAAACKSEAAAQTLAGISILAMSMYTGYTIPQDSMIWALRWITYINPFRYGFESLLTNEFHTLNGACVNLVPQGPAYQNITLSNQVCTTVGALPGQPYVQGSRFVELSLGYFYSHLWRNFGIICGFGAAFATALFVFTEINTKTSGYSAVVLYKRGTRIDTPGESPDQEKGPHKTLSEGQSPSATATLSEHIKSEDIFSFSHVSYTIPIANNQTKRLLEDISGYVTPGKLTALMGESGAGKTTLLNALAQRVDIGVVGGERFISGQPLPPDFQSQTGYCQQMDTHLPRTTIQEALLFSAKLRQPASVPNVEKEEYVNRCLRMCGLWPYRHAMIGSLNVELRKRTTIGVELAAKPRLLLFLDEPTSGLDSQSAWNIVKFLRSLADQGQAILCTIHQPSAELFQSFDKLLLLKKGGQTVYFGDLGHNSETLLRYFEHNGGRICTPGENPAEYMLDVIGAGATATTDQDWYGIWKKSPEFKVSLQEIEQIEYSGRNRPAIEVTRRTEFPTTWGRQLVELVKRGAIDHARNPVYIMAKIVLNIFAGLFIGFTFFKDQRSLQGAQNKLFSIFMSLILSVPLSNQLQIPFLDTRAVYEIRERPSRIYSWTALITSQLIVELPWNILGSSLFFLTWYWTSKMPTDRGGYAYLEIGILFPLYYTTIAQSFASMSPNAEVAAIIFGFLFSFVLTFNGVMQPFRQLGWWKWMYHLSPFTYLVEGLVGEVVGRHPTTCSPVEFVNVNPPSGMTCGQYMSSYISMAGGYLSDPKAMSDCRFCSTINTDQFLGPSFNIFYDHRWRNVGIFIAFSVLNIATIYLFTYLFRIRKGNLLRKNK
ncbi:pleiotropic drug resistance ABC transporter [Crepidotus variabilis]|uniref:Pleiotropic drug resistance ABC transporter n=1 Tax=Crepidotus variabilis TaxID=179855 RepID=A0A9P6EC57_9AGAR|nr:pleiotropic drug resistance ABC transporter [Crepidotus variabilis]